MQYQQGDYTVVALRPLHPPAPGAVLTAHVPADVAMRFQGRRFTRQELEKLGVLFQGDMAFVRDESGREWALELSPGL